MSSSRDLPGALTFGIDASHFLRQLSLKGDRSALAALARRCVDYLRITHEARFDPHDAPRILLALLQPSRVPVERSFVFGIHTRPPAQNSHPARLVGVLYFLHPPLRGDTWFIPLLLLEPAARGRGLGTSVHGAFRRWATARGATRLVVSVSDKNPQAWHFWRDRLGYQEVEPAAGERGHRELEHRWNDGAAPVPWCGQPPGSRRAG